MTPPLHLKILILFIISLPSVSAAITIQNPNQIFQLTNVNITFSNNITFSTLETGTDYIVLNGSEFYLIPTDKINVSILDWSSTGTYRKVWNESSSNANVTTQHTICGFPSNARIEIKKNGAIWNGFMSNSTGYITFINIVGYSEIQFELTLSSSSNDVDGNGIINIRDIEIIVEHINEITVAPYPGYDVNKDGIVNIFDVTIVSKHYGEVV